MAEKLKIIPLGGLNEIGKNMTAYEYGGEIIVVDCGMAFPGDDMYGIDCVIPDVTYLIKNRSRLRGLFITHGHEDHIGAIPYVLKQVNMPIYCTRFTAGLIKLKLQEHRLLDSTKLVTVEAGQTVKAGKFQVEFIHVNHSIVSYNYGKADSARLKQGIKYVTIIAFIYAVCIWSISMAFPVVYAKLFSASDSVTQIVMRYTPMFLMGSIMFFVQMTLQNVNVGLGQAKEALLLAVNRKVVILIPLCFALTQFLGFKGVYLSEGIADLVAGIVTTIVIFTSFPKIFRRREEEVKQAASN